MGFGVKWTYTEKQKSCNGCPICKTTVMVNQGRRPAGTVGRRSKRIRA